MHSWQDVAAFRWWTRPVPSLCGNLDPVPTAPFTRRGKTLTYFEHEKSRTRLEETSNLWGDYVALSGLAILQPALFLRALP